MLCLLKQQTCCKLCKFSINKEGSIKSDGFEGVSPFVWGCSFFCSIKELQLGKLLSVSWLLDKMSLKDGCEFWDATFKCFELTAKESNCSSCTSGGNWAKSQGGKLDSICCCWVSVNWSCCDWLLL